MAEVIENVVLRIAMQVLDAKLKAPDVQAATAAVKSLDDSINKANERMARSFESVEKKVAEATVQLKTAAAEEVKRSGALVQSQQRVADATINLSSSFREASEGVLRLNRGVALLAAAFDEDLAVAMQKYVLPAQAALDIFAGTVKISEQLIKVRKALATATTVLAAAEGTYTAAAVASATATKASVAAIGAFASAAAPVLAILGTAGVLLWKLKSAWDANEEAQTRAMELDRQHIEIFKRREAAIEAQTQALKRLADQHRSQRQDEATGILRLELERLRTLDPQQAIAGLRQLTRGPLVDDPQAQQRIAMMARGGNLGGASQMAQDRLGQLENEVSITRELLAAEREFASEQKRKEIERRDAELRSVEATGFVDPEFRQEHERETERRTMAIEAEFKRQADILNGYLGRLLDAMKSTTLQMNELRRDEEIAAITQGD